MYRSSIIFCNHVLKHKKAVELLHNYLGLYNGIRVSFNKWTEHICMIKLEDMLSNTLLLISNYSYFMDYEV